MYTRSKSFHDTTSSSTPKRRRLGTERILRQKNHDRSNGLINCSPINHKSEGELINSTERCESPHLPCNQVEFLCESSNSCSSDIPCSPGILSKSVIQDIENWESLIVSNNVPKKVCKNKTAINPMEELNEISDDMFHSKLEQSNIGNNLSKFDKEFQEQIEQSFDEINQSIYELTEPKICDKSSLFETKDSFLLDIKESEIVIEDKSLQPKELNKTKVVTSHQPASLNHGFYGLPVATKELFKTYRNIEKFYDWQEECLNLDAVHERRNLIYALPTSGGKTLVAEILMLREVIVRKKNALFILPFVAIVQEKIWSLSPFALQLDFLVEEYAAGKGHIPPKKRRKKNSIYIATIEKGLALIRSLIELGRLHEIGLIVVDELHLIGEKGRGGTLETLLTTVLFTNQNIQIVGMSATIGNLPDIAKFLKAEVFQSEFRPVELDEYVKLGDMVYKIVYSGNGLEIVPHRQVTYNYSASAARLDPDRLGGLVAEVVPAASCLVFCPTKRNCENVAALLCTLQTPAMAAHRAAERTALCAALRSEGAAEALVRCARRGLAFHHAGLAADERALLEHAFRSGVVSVVCCTSTLAAGVNLPAARVVVRAPRVARRPLALAAYRQMAGRAGRAGHCATGESIIICSPAEWPQLRSVLAGGIAPAKSVLADCLDGLIMSAVSLQLANTRSKLRELLGTTLLAITHTKEDSASLDINGLCDASLESLIKSGALELLNDTKASSDPSKSNDCYVYNDSLLTVSKLGKAAIKGCMDLATANQLIKDLELASHGLILMGSLHLLYLVTPHDAAGIKPDYRHYYSLYCNLDEEGVQTAKILGITEMNAIRMMTGKCITNVPETVICRFYLAMMLHDLWKQVPFATVAEKYGIARGTVQSVMSSASAFACSAHRLCEELPARWPFAALLAALAPRLHHCAAPELLLLMDLPAVKKTRALQLVRAGYKRVEDVAKAAPDQLLGCVSHLSRTAAEQLVAAARMMLIEKVENLRAEAEDVMEELKV